jgi:putative phosphoribosyl transferase
MAEVNIVKKVSMPSLRFQDRADAGGQLVHHLHLEPDPDAIVLALPRGGIPVGDPLAEALQAPLEPFVTKKIPVPSSPEMGYGAVAYGGGVYLNEDLLAHLRLSEESINEGIDQARQEIERQVITYSGQTLGDDIRGRRVFLVDDGLATGFTMYAAAKMVDKYVPESITVAVPTATADAIRRLEPIVNTIHCLFVQEDPPFAVASYYEDFHELTDDDVLNILERRAPDRKST